LYIIIYNGQNGFKISYNEEKKMKFLTSLCVLFSLLLFPAFSQVQANLEKADALYDSDAYQPCKDLLLTTLELASANQEKAGVLWRLSRVTQTLGDLAEEKGTQQAELLKYYEEGEKYADQGVAADPQNPLPYFWKAANMGRWGQVKGILNALGKAQPMLDQLKLALAQAPDDTDSFYVLQKLYVQVPGWPVSFGNKEYGVSLGRKAVDLMQKDLRLLMHAANESGVCLPASSLVHHLFTAAQSAGHGKSGTQALYTVMQRLAAGK
jgi:tetratricopeptide (TPR) repeat protein